MNISINRVMLLLLLAFLLPFNVLALGASENNNDDAPVVSPLQILFEAMDDEVPSIAILAPETAPRVDQALVKAITDDVIREFIETEWFRPYSINVWLDEIYDKREDSIIGFVNRLKSEGFLVNSILTSSFREINGVTSIKLGVYDMQRTLTPVYFWREVRDFEHWQEISPLLYQEMRIRSTSAPQSYVESSIYVEPFPIRIYHYTELSTGEFDFVELPMLRLGRMDLRQAEDLVRDIISYEFHSSRILSVVSADSPDYYRSIGRSPCRYALRGEMRITDRINMLVFHLYDTSGRIPVRMLEYQIPFSDLDIKNLRDITRQMTRIVYNEILSGNELRRVSFQDFDVSRWGNVMFFQSYYIGNPVQNDFCLPLGSHWFTLLRNDSDTRTASIDEANVAVFVSPLDYSNSIHDRVEARYIQKLLENRE